MTKNDYNIKYTNFASLDPSAPINETQSQGDFFNSLSHHDMQTKADMEGRTFNMSLVKPFKPQQQSLWDGILKQKAMRDLEIENRKKAERQRKQNDVTDNLKDKIQINKQIKRMELENIKFDKQDMHERVQGYQYDLAHQKLINKNTK